MGEKQLTIGALLAVVLLTLVFTPPAHQQDSSSYDPWLDYNEDGIIDANDLQAFGQTYGTSGSRTRNMNITNWPVDEQGNLRIKAAEKPVQTYKDSVEITALDWTEVTNNGIQYGTPVAGHEVKAEFPFAYSCKQVFQKTTHTAVMIILKAAHQYRWRLNITLNGNPVLAEFRPAYEGYPAVMSIRTNDLNVLQTIVPGIGMLTIKDAMYYNTANQQWQVGYIWIFRATIFIEYEYQA